MISSRKLPSKCSLHIASRLATARTELGPLSVMYSTITTAVAAAGADASRSFLLRAIAGLRQIKNLPWELRNATEIEHQQPAEWNPPK